jgi:hypothetical protein
MDKYISEILVIMEKLWHSTDFWRSLFFLLLVAMGLAYLFRRKIRKYFLRPEIAERDRSIFIKAENILGEQTLINFLREIEDFHCYYGASMRAGKSFFRYFEKESNRYITKELKKSVTCLNSSIKDLLEFSTKHFFPSPTYQRGNNWRFELYPDDEDKRGKKTDRYKKATKGLYKRTCDVRNKYNKYRITVKRKLVV